MSLSTSVQLTSIPSSFDSSKLMGNWKYEFLCFTSEYSFYLNHMITTASRVTFCEHLQLLTVSKLVLPFSSSAAGGLQLLSAASRNICGQLLTLIVGSSVEYFGKLQSHSKINPVSAFTSLWTLQSTLQSRANSVGCRTTCAFVPPSSKQHGPHSSHRPAMIAVILSCFCFLIFFSVAVPWLPVSVC